MITLTMLAYEYRDSLLIDDCKELDRLLGDTPYMLAYRYARLLTFLSQFEQLIQLISQITHCFAVVPLKHSLQAGPRSTAQYHITSWLHVAQGCSLEAAPYSTLHYWAA